MKPEIRNFLLQHPVFFIDNISGDYNLPIQLIEKYKDYWNWRWLTYNDSIQWTEELILKYEDFLAWWDPNDSMGSGIQDHESFPWSMEIINQYKEKIEKFFQQK